MGLAARPRWAQRVGGTLAAALLFAAPAGCSDGDDWVRLPGGDVVGPAAPAPAKDAVLFHDFQAQEPSGWDVLSGAWELRDVGTDARAYAAQPREFGLSLTGQSNWKDYTVEAQLVIQDDRFGHVGVVGHANWDHHYFELVLGRDQQGVKSWFLRQRSYHDWTTLASGPIDYQYATAYVVRLGFHGQELRASMSRDGGRTFNELGYASALADSWTTGRAGLVSYGGDASFDDVTVRGSEVLFSQAQPWGAISAIRDKSNSGAAWPGTPPADGWYVTPIHATVRASDGKVFIFGFGRKGLQNCSGSTAREVGETWLLDPAQLDALNGATLNVTPINEQNQAIQNHVLYCAGHNTLADGRIFLSAGTDYSSSGGLPDASPELGLKYSRIYNPATNTITRISALMTGGTGNPGSTYAGMKWYPTNLLMPDGKVLIFGGFHYSAGVTGVPKDNRSFETFDPAIWDANPNANPYQLLMDHEQGSSQTTPTRGYTNLFLLPRPVPAASAGTFARSVAVHGGFGKVFLFNHEPGPSGSARLHQKTNALNPLNGSSNEKGEGASGVMLADGTLMFANGGHQGAGAARAYFYDPYLNPTTASQGWSSLDLGISRMYSDAVALPNGQILIINGYNNANEPGNEMDISNPVGDVRRPQIVNPYPPRSKTDLAAWPEPTHRGYHSIAVLLKDGRILVGGGKDQSHATGCEKNEIRIYEPPYLFAGPRPVISAPAEHSTMTVGGAPVTIQFSGATLAATRGVVLMSPGSITHGFDMGQRYVPLKVLLGPADGQVTVAPPPNINVAQPGDYMLFLVSDAGAPSTTGVHIRLLPPPARVYNLGGDVYVEAECSSRRSGPWNVVDDGTRSESQYIQVGAGGTGNHTAANAIDEGEVMWYDLNLPGTANASYNLWFLTQGPTTGSDSFWVSVDGGPDTQLGATPSWSWVKLGTTTFSLSPGKHQLKVKVRELGAQIDKIFLTKTTATPAGLGGAAQITCGGAPPMCTAPPAPGPVDVSPADCQATVSWNNVAGEDGYRIRRNGTLLPGTIPANTTSFVDAPLAAGSYTYEVQAFQGTCDSPFAAAGAVTVTCTPPTNPTITNLVVNDTATTNPPAGSDGIANSTQWSIQAGFTGGVLSHGDRSNTIDALTGTAATRLAGKPWIRTAADSKNYAPQSPPLATFTASNSTRVSLGVDSRHATAFLTNNGWVNQGFSFGIHEGANARTYNVWSKTITSPTTVTLPTINATTAPCYVVILE